MRNLPIARRLLILVAVSLSGLILLGGLGLWELRSILEEDRRAKTSAMVETAHSVLAGYVARAEAGELSLAQAQALALKAVGAIRYDNGNYFWVQSTDNEMLMHPLRPDMTGQSLDGLTDPAGSAFFDEMTRTAKAGGGFVNYLWPRSEGAAPSRKVSYVLPVDQWGWIVGSGLYLDDVEAIFWRDLQLGLGVIALLMAIVGMLAFSISRGISRPLALITGGMRRLTEGDTSITISGTDRGDEVGDLARSMAVFKDKLIENEDMRAQQERDRIRAEEDQRRMMHKMADDFESTLGEVLSEIGGASEELQRTAQSMSTIAAQTSERSNSVSETAERTSANVQTVASASEELAASIAEIGRQVNQSNEIVRQAVDIARNTTDKVNSLTKVTDRIGAVIGTITDIASQTNLLALNATIEANRAGEAGRGFAVVAEEVKVLAQQTAGATEDIASQISAVQAETTEAVKSIDAICQIITEIHQIASSIASAVEEQSAATAEIARNVEQAANGTETMTVNIRDVTAAALETDAASSQVLSSSGSLAEQSALLKEKMSGFLETVRAA